MRILFVSHYFLPESFQVNQLVMQLASEGHEITVATGKPNYPGGTIYQGYNFWGVVYERIGPNLEVLRTPVIPRGNGQSLQMVLNYMSAVFFACVLWPWYLRHKGFDCILVFGASPLTVSLPAILLKYLKQVPLCLWIQDLWPLSLKATGHVSNKFVLRCVGQLMAAIYYCCDLLLIQSREFAKDISNYTSKVPVYYPNSVPEQPLVIGDTLECNQDLREVLNKNFCVTFAGNLGRAQALAVILAAAELLLDIENFKIVFVGSGSMEEWAQERARVLGLHNVVFAGRYPMEVMPCIYQQSSVLLVTLRNEEIFSVTVPSKVQSYLASGKPIAAAINGAGAKIIRDSGAGLVVDAEDSTGLSVILRRFHTMSVEELQGLGDCGRKYFYANFELKVLSKRLIDLLREISR